MLQAEGRGQLTVALRRQVRNLEDLQKQDASYLGLVRQLIGALFGFALQLSEPQSPTPLLVLLSLLGLVLDLV